jgi:hypothetical protein
MKTATQKSVWWLLLIAAGIIGATWLAWHMGADPLAPGNVSSIANEAIQPWRIPLMIGRWGLWCLAWYQWHWIGQKLFTGMSERARAQQNQWQSMRNRMMGGIAIVEAIILISDLTGG